MKTLYESILNIDTNKTTSVAKENQEIVDGICDILRKYFRERTKGFTNSVNLKATTYFFSSGKDKIAYSSVALTHDGIGLSDKKDIANIKKLADKFNDEMCKFLDTDKINMSAHQVICYSFHGDKVRKLGFKDGFYIEFHMNHHSYQYSAPRMVLPSFLLSKLTEG